MLNYSVAELRVIINVIYSLDDKSREKVAENPKIIVTFAFEI